jgi:hypothetical protein
MRANPAKEEISMNNRIKIFVGLAVALILGGVIGLFVYNGWNIFPPKDATIADATAPTEPDTQPTETATTTQPTTTEPITTEPAATDPTTETTTQPATEATTPAATESDQPTQPILYDPTVAGAVNQRLITDEELLAITSDLLDRKAQAVVLKNTTGNTTKEVGTSPANEWGLYDRWMALSGFNNPDYTLPLKDVKEKFSPSEKNGAMDTLTVMDRVQAGDATMKEENFFKILPGVDRIADFSGDWFYTFTPHPFNETGADGTPNWNRKYSDSEKLFGLWYPTRGQKLSDYRRAMLGSNGKDVNNLTTRDDTYLAVFIGIENYTPNQKGYVVFMEESGAVTDIFEFLLRDIRPGAGITTSTGSATMDGGSKVAAGDGSYTTQGSAWLKDAAASDRELVAIAFRDQPAERRFVTVVLPGLKEANGVRWTGVYIDDAKKMTPETDFVVDAPITAQWHK